MGKFKKKTQESNKIFLTILATLPISVKLNDDFFPDLKKIAMERPFEMIPNTAKVGLLYDVQPTFFPKKIDTHFWPVYGYTGI